MDNKSAQRMKELIGESVNPNKKRTTSEDFISSDSLLKSIAEKRALNEQIDPGLFDVYEFENDLEINESDSDYLYDLNEDRVINLDFLD